MATGCATERVDESWSYTVTLTTTDPPRVSVEARFVGEDPAFRAFATPDRQGMPYIEGLRLDTGSQLIPTDDAAGPTTFALAEPSRQAILRYSFDLDDLAADVRDLKVASHAGSAVFAAWTAWLLIPDGDRDAEVDLTFVSTTPDGSIAVAIDDAERGTVRVRSSALRERIYAVFGDLEVGRREVHRQGQGGPAPARLTVVSPRRAFTLSGADHAGWVHENAELIGAFAGAFPVDATLIVLIPIPGDGGPVFGRVQPSIAPTLLAFVGASSATSALEEDWILVHELLHLTFPPVSQRDRWIDEGIATYFEPVLRARAGRISEAEMWAEYVKGLPRGLHALEEVGLANGRGIDDVYWGGALFCFLADVEIRRRTAGARGLEDGLRGLSRAGWSVTGPMRSVRAIFPIIDQTVGCDVLGPLWHRYVAGHATAPLTETLASLGVESTPSGIRLREDAPLAAVRRAMVAGGSPRPATP